MIKQLAFALLISVLSLNLLAAEIAGNVELAEGKVWIQGADNKMRAIKPDQPIYEGDVIITGVDGELQVRMKDDAFIAVRPNSKLKIETYRAQGDADDTATFSLLLGTFRSVTGWIGKYNRDNYSINTRTATIGVRGTDHEPMYIPPAVPGMPPIGEPGVYDKVNSGRIVVKNAFGETEFDKGQAAFVGLNSRQAAVRLKGIPDFFKPSQHEQRIEDARQNLQPNLDSSLLKRQQLIPQKGVPTRPLLRPQALPDQNLQPETRPTAPEEKSDSKLLPGARPTAPTRSHEQLNTPVAPRSMPGVVPSPQVISPETLTPPKMAPISPADTRIQPLVPQPGSTTLEPPTRLAPVITPSSGFIQPQTLTPAPVAKTELPTSQTLPTITTKTTTPVLQPIAPKLLSTQLLAPVPLTSETQKTTTEEPAKIAPTLTSPTLLQAPTKLLLPAR